MAGKLGPVDPASPVGFRTTVPAAAAGLPSPSGANATKAGGASHQRAQLKHAALLVYEPKPAKSGPGLDAKVDEIAFQFNPKEVTIAKSAKWAPTTIKKSKKTGPPEFKGSDPCKLTFEMFFDATGAHDGSVVASVERLLHCCVPTEKSLKNNKPSGYIVILVWGSIRSFPAYVTQVSAKYTLFAADGTPIRAVCSVSMEEMPMDPPPKQNPTSGSISVQRMHTVTDGDSLASVAYAEYGEAGLWRAVAKFNRIDDPMALRSGQALMLPALEDLVVAGVDR